MTDKIVVLITVDEREHARSIARGLVERRIAACVNAIPGVVSTYRWKGEVCEDEELLLVVKTRADRLDRLREAVVELHPYEVPEIVALPIADGLPAYLDWIDESVGAEGVS